MKGKRIYLLDDDADIRNIIELMLSRQGYIVTVFKSIAEIKHQISISLPDMFMLDVSLPDGNGLELSQWLSNNATSSHIPVLLLSAVSQSDRKRREAGAWDFVDKPFEMNDLLARVHKLL